MLDPTKLTDLQWGIVPLIIYLRYIILAGAVYLVFYVWKRRDWLHMKIQQRFPHHSDYRREVWYSTLTSLIFSVQAYICLGTPLRQYTQFYSDIHAYSMTWFFLSIPIAIAIHDTFFYWAHRWMHQPKVYKWMHRTHHLSINPSPWATFSFHPAEAVVEGLIVPILLFTIPLHPLAFFAFIFFMLVFNVYGHLGYELFPKKLYQHPLGKWLNSSIYHNLHHEKFTGNYGLYFSFWDRVCGTMRVDNAEKVEQIHEQMEHGAVQHGREFVS
ncbi:MAG: sterol desaturase family protein [Saprospiraceae bacterium]|nr:sterol desaturase family protein [Saprospiraceae bacterium]